MTYFFFLGSNPSISMAEIIAANERLALGFADFKLIRDNVLEAETREGLDAHMLIRQLGGTVKIGRLVDRTDKKVDTAVRVVAAALLQRPDDRLHFGLSNYGFPQVKAVGLEVKKALLAAGKKARWVVSREQVLSSVVVEQNKLLKSGADFSLVPLEGKLVIVETLAVQPFKELSRRDYGRPERDDQSGMLPPKLAQMMLNLALSRNSNNVLDPFCGSGTILMEAALLGVREIFGSDISDKAVFDSRDNTEWLKKKALIQEAKFVIRNSSATELTKTHKPGSIDCIATEPFLGPQRGEYEVRQVVSDLEKLYGQAIAEFFKLLKPGGRAVMVWPVFKAKQDRIYLSARIAGQFQIAKPLPDKFLKLGLKLTNRQTLLYGRPDQRVWREIVILQK